MGKTILVTGASTGIGAAICRHLAEGNDIIVHYHQSKDAAVQVGEAVGQSGGNAHLVAADLASEKGCDRLAGFVAETVGKLDVLVNNAGGLIERQQIADYQWELMQQTFELNVFSAMKLTSLCLPLLRKGTHPCIVNITSLAARTGAPTATIYGAAKAALDALTRGMARELAPEIRANAVAPGVIETPFHDKVSTPEMLENWKQNTPLRCLGHDSQIASAVRLLVENQFITGESIDINGGLSMR